MQNWVNDQEKTSSPTESGLCQASSARGYQSDRLPGHAGNYPPKRVYNPQVSELFNPALDIPHNRPYPRPPKPYPIKRVSRMTMAASVRFADGVLVCADRMMTKGQTSEAMFASYQRKLEHIEGKAFDAIMVGSGDDDVIRAVIDETTNLLPRAQQRYETEYFLPSEEIKRQFDVALSEVYEKASPSQGANLILAVHTIDKQIRTFRSEGKIASAAKPLEIMGIGENSLISFLRDSLYAETMSYEEAVGFAALIVFAAKKYCPQYVGGETDIMALRVGSQSILEPKKEKISAIEELFKEQMFGQFVELLAKAATLVS